MLVVYATVDPAFGPLGITVHVPDAEGRGWLHERYIGQLLKGVFTDETREGVEALVEVIHYPVRDAATA